MTLPVSRMYSGRNDLQSMINLLLAVRPTNRITDYPSIVDLRERLTLTNVQDNTHLWFDANDQIVGFAFVDPYNNLCFEFDKQAIYPNIESEIVIWGVECIRRAMNENGNSMTLDASCRDDDTERISMFERHGFVRQEMRSLHMARSLDKPIATPQVPQGFSIRHIAGEQ